MNVLNYVFIEFDDFVEKVRRQSDKLFDQETVITNRHEGVNWHL